MPQKKKKVAKVFTILALAAICVSVIAPFVLYFGTSNMPDHKCGEGLTRNSQTMQCQEISDESDDAAISATGNFDEESCLASSGTWYPENNVCIH